MQGLAHVDFMDVALHPMTMRETLVHVRAALRAGRTINAASLNVAKLVGLRRDPALRADLLAADLVLADGMGIVWGARVLGQCIPERVAGVDLMERMLEMCAEEGWQPYFLGARPEVLARAVAEARRRHPGLSVAGSQHGYYDGGETPAIVAAIRASGATCLFVGMPTPRKEQFLARHAAELGVPFLMGVGGSLDILAGETARAPRLWQKAGLEWLFRVIQEPRRMWRRYLTTNLRFAGLLAWALARKCVEGARGNWGHPVSRVVPKLAVQPVAAAYTESDTGVVRCRKIVTADLPAVQSLLREGFPNRPEDWFGNALASLARHKPPSEFPQFGYALDCGGRVVGALLVIASASGTGGHMKVRRNASCWYVKPAFRVYAPILIDHGVRRCGATDVNISPASHTWPIIEAQGFKRFSHGMFVGVPLLSVPRARSRALSWEAATSAGWPMSDAQSAVLREHNSFGCFSLVCHDDEGVTVCVFRERRFRRVPFSGAQVIFCERPDDVRRFAFAIGCHLFRRGYTWLALNADGPVAGMAGLWFPERAPMYYRGADKPASCDLLYTEAALFGF